MPTKTKLDLIHEVSDLKLELNRVNRLLKESNEANDLLNDNIIIGLKRVIDDTCSDSHEHIERFCDIVGVDFPKTTLTVEVEVIYGNEIHEIQDNEYDTVNFKVIKSE